MVYVKAVNPKEMEKKVVLKGTITGFKWGYTRNRPRRVGFVKLRCEDGNEVEVIIFPYLMSKHGNVLAAGFPLTVVASVRLDEGIVKYLAEEIVRP